MRRWASFAVSMGALGVAAAIMTFAPINVWSVGVTLACFVVAFVLTARGWVNDAADDWAKILIDLSRVKNNDKEET